MKSRFRLLPVIIFMAALTLTVKLGSLWQGLDGIVAPSRAQESKTAAAGKPVAKLAATDPVSSGTKTENKDKAGKRPEKIKNAEKKDAAVAEGEAKPAAKPWFDPAIVTDAELQVLQNLSERRKQIEEQEANVELRKELLKATEQRIDKKIAELKEIQKTIEGLLKKHQAQTDKKMKSLVKIYENMKPKDAARIFEQLDMAILLDVVERMREAKAAPIMANMKPSRAKAVTAALAQRRALPKPEKPNQQ